MKFKTKLFLGIFGLLIFLIAFSAFSETITEDNSSNINKYNENQLNLSDSAVIWTDKEDYSPGETVIIYGSGFNTTSIITITITRPDESEDIIHAISDTSGDFTHSYELNGIEGIYTVIATDGTNSASTTFTDCCPPPTIQLMKTADKTCAHVGDTITYTITVKNTNNFRLYCVLDDVMLNIHVTGYLQAGKTYTRTDSIIVTEEHGDIIENVATVTGTDDCGRVVEESVSWIVDVYHPAIKVEKVPAKTCYHEGDIVSYTFYITNIGDIELD
ncbi:MAG: hypothetical protein ACFFBY_05475, partial [Promethearchaeota archaeon]